MTDIDVPDWVVEVAAEAISKRHLSNTGIPFPIKACRDDAEAALRAALSAWVVPVMWKHDRCGWTPIDEALIATHGQITYAYTLRQEKPE